MVDLSKTGNQFVLIVGVPKYHQNGESGTAEHHDPEARDLEPT